MHHTPGCASPRVVGAGCCVPESSGSPQMSGSPTPVSQQRLSIPTRKHDGLGFDNHFPCECNSAEPPANALNRISSHASIQLEQALCDQPQHALRDFLEARSMTGEADSFRLVHTQMELQCPYYTHCRMVPQSTYLRIIQPVRPSQFTPCVIPTIPIRKSGQSPMCNSSHRKQNSMAAPCKTFTVG